MKILPLGLFYWGKAWIQFTGVRYRRIDSQTAEIYDLSNSVIAEYGSPRICERFKELPDECNLFRVDTIYNPKTDSLYLGRFQEMGPSALERKREAEKIATEKAFV